MTTILRDFKFGFRMLPKSPGHTAAAVLALGLGIGLTTAMFSIVYGVILRACPSSSPTASDAPGARQPVQRTSASLEVYLQDFLDWRERQNSFEGLAAFYATHRQPERRRRASPSASTAPTCPPTPSTLLRVKPLLGPRLPPRRGRAQARAGRVLGYGLWQTRYGGDPQVIGRTVRVNGEPVDDRRRDAPGLRLPHRTRWSGCPCGSTRPTTSAASGTLEVFGRLKDGVDLEQRAGRDERHRPGARRRSTRRPTGPRRRRQALHRGVHRRARSPRSCYTMLGGGRGSSCCSPAPTWRA